MGSPSSWDVAAVGEGSPGSAGENVWFLKTSGRGSRVAPALCPAHPTRLRVKIGLVFLLQKLATALCCWRAFGLLLDNSLMSVAINRHTGPCGVSGCTASRFWTAHRRYQTRSIKWVSLSIPEWWMKYLLALPPCLSSISGSQCTSPWQCSTNRWERAQCVNSSQRKFVIPSNSRCFRKKDRESEHNSVLVCWVWLRWS